jgi:outer membrane protein assembly factor BamB
VCSPLALLIGHSFGATRSVAPVIASGKVFYTTRVSAQQGGVLYALDIKTGQKIWSFPNDAGLQSGHYFSATPTVDGNRIYVPSSNGSVYIIDATTGKEAAPSLSLGRKIESSPIIEDGILYFGSNDGKFYALNPLTGWTRGCDDKCRLTMTRATRSRLLH